MSLGHAPAASGFAVLTIWTWIIGLNLIGHLPGWMILASPIGRLNSARISLSPALRQARRNWLITAGILAALFGLVVAVSWLKS